MARLAAPTRAGQRRARLSADAASLEALLANEGIMICLRIGREHLFCAAGAAPLKANHAVRPSPDLGTIYIYRFSIDRSNECL